MSEENQQRREITYAEKCHMNATTKTWIAYGNSPGMQVNTRYT